MLSVVIPTYQKLSRLRLSLYSLLSVARDEAPDTEVIVVDDGGEEGLRDILEQVTAESNGPSVRLCERPHGGRSAARNWGAASASGKRILFLDDDVLVTPGVLKSHRQRGLQFPQAFLRGTILRLPWLASFENPANGTFTQCAQQSLGMSGTARGAGLLSRRVEFNARGYPHDRLGSFARMSQFEKDVHAWLAGSPPEKYGRWVASTGAHLSVEKETLFSLKGFDDAMGKRWGAEDLELGYRAEKAGIQILHVPEAVVYHMDHETHGREGDHEAALEYFARKHNDPNVLKLLSYFSKKHTLSEVFAA